MPADAPDPAAIAEDPRTVREHRSVLARQLAYAHQALRHLEADVARWTAECERLRVELAEAKEGEAGA